MFRAEEFFNAMRKYGEKHNKRKKVRKTVGCVRGYMLCQHFFFFALMAVNLTDTTVSVKQPVKSASHLVRHLLFVFMSDDNKAV